MNFDYISGCMAWSILGLLLGVALGYAVRYLHERTSRP